MTILHFNRSDFFLHVKSSAWHFSSFTTTYVLIQKKKNDYQHFCYALDKKRQKKCEIESSKMSYVKWQFGTPTKCVYRYRLLSRVVSYNTCTETQQTAKCVCFFLFLNQNQMNICVMVFHHIHFVLFI